MDNSLSIAEFLKTESVAGEFRPYSVFSRSADALTFYFRPDRDYSKRLTEHVTLYFSMDTDQIVGCRIKGISGIVEDLPNYVDVDHGGQRLKCIFLAQRGAAGGDAAAREALNQLARKVDNVELQEVD